MDTAQNMIGWLLKAAARQADADANPGTGFGAHAAAVAESYRRMAARAADDVARRAERIRLHLGLSDPEH